MEREDDDEYDGMDEGEDDEDEDYQPAVSVLTFSLLTDIKAQLKAQFKKHAYAFNKSMTLKRKKISLEKKFKLTK